MLKCELTVIQLCLLGIVIQNMGFGDFCFSLPELFSSHNPRDNSTKTVTKLSKRDGKDAL